MSEEEAEVAAIEVRAHRVDTPCGEGTMAWRIWGDGTPVVLSHGSQGSWSHWIRNIDALVAAGRQVIAADMPGFGDSALPREDSHDAIAEALVTGLETILGPGVPVDLVGFSFGGCAFANFAARRPDLARRVIIIGSGGLDTPHGHIDIGPVRGLTGEARTEALIRNLNGLMLAHRASADALARHLLIANARKSRLNPVPLVVPDRIVQILPTLRVPLDAIWGAFDRPHPDPQLQKAVIRRYQPECDFRVVEDAGHWAMYERPDAFNATLIAMLEAGPPPRALPA